MCAMLQFTKDAVCLPIIIVSFYFSQLDGTEMLQVTPLRRTVASPP